MCLENIKIIIVIMLNWFFELINILEGDMH